MSALLLQLARASAGGLAEIKPFSANPMALRCASSRKRARNVPAEPQVPPSLILRATRKSNKQRWSNATVNDVSECACRSMSERPRRSKREMPLPERRKRISRERALHTSRNNSVYVMFVDLVFSSVILFICSHGGACDYCIWLL